jgi:NADH dehydrogenase
MSRFTLARDFRSIDAAAARVILIEAGPRILPSFCPEQAARAVRDLEQLGVQVWTNSAVTHLDEAGVTCGRDRLQAATVLWAAGVAASPLGRAAGWEVDRQGRVLVHDDLSLAGHPNVFVLGDQASCRGPSGQPLPGTAPVAMQQGRYIARLIRDELAGRPRKSFHFVDKGQMATIGRSRAIVEIGRWRIAGSIAWLLWLVVHIYYLTGFRNRLLVVLQWAWSYCTFRRGARLIVDRDWRMYAGDGAVASGRAPDSASTA